jgi:hypothetical protein
LVDSFMEYIGEKNAIGKEKGRLQSSYYNLCQPYKSKTWS